MAERELTYREALNEALRQEMRRDDTVILMGEDIAGGAGQPKEMQDAWGGVLGVTKGLYTEFGAMRVMDTPIAESGYVGAAIGAAATGLRPVAELMFIGFMAFVSINCSTRRRSSAICSAERPESRSPSAP